MDLISFVLPAYKIRFLDQAIRSILNQSYSNIELVIVNDASPEHLEDVVDQFEDPRIKYYRNAENIGGKSLVAQWNHCINYAQGSYIVLAADDDIYEPDFAMNCISLANKYPEVDLIRSRVAQIDEMNELIGIDGVLPESCSKHQFLYYWINATAFTCIGNYMFKSTALLAKKFIDFPFGYGADVASAISLAENGVANTSEMLFNFRISTIQLSSSHEHLIPKLKATTMLYRWLMNLNYQVADNKLDIYCQQRTKHSALYLKCKYDYYNQVIKYLPFYKFYIIRNCDLLTAKDKVLMCFRFWVKKMINIKVR